MQPQDIRQAADRVIRAIRRTDDDGNPVHSEAVIRHFVPWMAVHMKADFSQLPGPVQALVAAFIEALELPEGATYDDLVEATRAYYEAFPVDPALKRDVERAMQSALTELSAANAGEVAHRRIEGSSGAGVFRNALSARPVLT